MKYEFTLNGLPASLDTDSGVFTFEEEKTKQAIEKEIADAKAYGEVGGGCMNPFRGVNITAPYHDIYQFSACLFEGIMEHRLPEIKGDGIEEAFPKELYPYAPHIAGLYEGMPSINVFLGTKEEFDFYSKELEEMEKFGVVF